jgi:hypothetical protein
MHKFYTFSIIIFSAFLLISFSTNPPDGNTGAPGDNLCIQCHIQTNPSLNGTITIEGFPDVITPNETYLLTAVNRLTTGTAVRAGFQVTILGPTNTKAGELKNPSTSSVVSVQAGRQYWDHNPAVLYPDSNVVRWTVEWTAPELSSGSLITWYAAGNVANGNFQNTGDRIVAATGSGSIVLSSTDDIKTNQLVVFPNPGRDQINILSPDKTSISGEVYFYNLTGEIIGEATLNDGMVSVPHIAAGIYLMEIRNDGISRFAKWSKL